MDPVVELFVYNEITLNIETDKLNENVFNVAFASQFSSICI